MSNRLIIAVALVGAAAGLSIWWESEGVERAGAVGDASPACGPASEPAQVGCSLDSAGLAAP